MDKCPVCLGAHLGGANIQEARGGYGVDCPACGLFGLSEEAWSDYLDPENQSNNILPVHRSRLSHRIRRASLDGEIRRPKIDRNFIERLIKAGWPGPTPAEQAVNLVTFIGDQVLSTGERPKSLPDSTYALIGAPNPRAVHDLAVELLKKGWLVGSDAGSSGVVPRFVRAGLTLTGWDVYESEKAGKFSGKLGFIAMKFGDPVLENLVENTIKKAIKDRTGYSLFDMRDVAQAGIIDNIMRNQIRDSAFVIVDLTHDNSGAYWEAGYAEGLGKPVIYICEAKKFDGAKTHFDTNHCTTVVWSEEDTETFTANLVATLRRSLNLFDS